MDTPLKLALPKGRLMEETAALLDDAGWGFSGYNQGSRSYRLKSTRFPHLSAKVFHEKDIPIQVAIGNYDLGICGLDWAAELLVRYLSSAVVKVRELEHGRSLLYMAGSPGTSLGKIPARQGVTRIATEYPNLAEAFAVRHRLRRFSIFPVWGAAEVYPPESADLALVSVKAEEDMAASGLMPVSRVLTSSALLIANRNSWESKDMRRILDSIGSYREQQPAANPRTATAKQRTVEPADGDTVWLALPDGHQQAQTCQLLARAGIEIDDYQAPTGNRRPAANLAGVRVKLIRPQDMPTQVANGNFDLAISGRDWLLEHLYQFPSSPVTELLDLKFGKVKIVAVVGKNLAVEDSQGLRQLSSERSVPLRVASEYVNIADKYARDNHLGRYRLVPTWGATEGFLPEDADLLIENTQTGQTLSRHNLKTIAQLLESTACLIGSTTAVFGRSKGERIRSITAALRAAVEG
ncbi:ATP phosphoribosyltransferase [Chloroflexota bacterium]